MTARLAGLQSLFFTALLGLACGPLGPLPGGQISGELGDPPIDWSFTDAHKTVQLETNMADPYSVNIWGATIGKSFYIASRAGRDTKWAANIETAPDVRLGVDGKIFELRAVRVDHDKSTRKAFLESLHKKYDFSPDDAESSGAWLYRLDPR